MLAGRHDRRPASTWIEPDVEIEPDVTIHPFAVLRGRRDRRPARRSATRSRSTPRSDRSDRRPVLLPSSRNGPRGGLEGGHLRGDQELTHRRPDEGAPPVVHRRRRDRRGHEHRRRHDHRELPAPARPAEGRTTIGSNVRTGIHNGFVAPVEVGDGAWIAPDSVITEDVPADALGISRARQENKEGYAHGKRTD